MILSILAWLGFGLTVSCMLVCLGDKASRTSQQTDPSSPPKLLISLSVVGCIWLVTCIIGLHNIRLNFALGFDNYLAVSLPLVAELILIVPIAHMYGLLR